MTHVKMKTTGIVAILLFSSINCMRVAIGGRVQAILVLCQSIALSCRLFLVRNRRANVALLLSPLGRPAKSLSLPRKLSITAKVTKSALSRSLRSFAASKPLNHHSNSNLQISPSKKPLLRQKSGGARQRKRHFFSWFFSFAPLNQRLQNGEQGKLLIEWLNSLSEVQSVLTAQFNGQPILAANLSAWRKGGYVDWEDE